MGLSAYRGNASAPADATSNKPILITLSGGAGNGTVTSIAAGAGIVATPDPITMTGNIAVAGTANVIAWLADPTSAKLAAALTDETGSGPNVFATEPTLTNPAGTSQALTDGASVDWNASSGAIATWTIGGNRTLNAPTNLKAGGRYILRITQDGTGGRTVTWNSVFKPARGTATMPQPQLTAGSVTSFEFESNGTNLYLINDNGWTLLDKQTASASATLDFTSLVGYAGYVLMLDNIIPATNNVVLYLRVGVDGVYETATYRHSHFSIVDSNSTGQGSSQSDSKIIIADPVSNDSNNGVNGQTLIVGFDDAKNHYINFDLTYFDGTAIQRAVGFGGGFATQTPKNCARIYYSSGNIASGTIRCYGLRG